jgi:RHS repeat-associated protein
MNKSSKNRTMKHTKNVVVVLFAGLQLSAPTLSSAQSSRTTTFSYDAVGQVTSVTLPGGRTRQLQWDAFGRNVQELRAGASVGYGFNHQDALTAVQDPKGLVTSYDRNGFGEARGQTSPDTGSTTFARDAAGNVTSRVNAAGQTESYTYDADNRVTSKLLTHPGLGSLTYSFAYGTSGVEAGALVQVSAPGMTLGFAHNVYGQVTSATQALAGSPSLTVGYSYANNGAPTSVTYPSGRVVTYALDAASRIAGVTVDGSQVLSGVSYSALGAITGWSFAGGQAVARNYDSSARVTSVTMPWGARQYGYDVDDRIVGINDSLLGSGTYGYDNQDRLTSASNGAGTWSYQYDANGNRTAGTSNGSGYGTSVDAASNRMLAAGQWQNTFTADGQTAQVANGGSLACGPSLTLGYQADGQLVTSNALSAKHAPNGLRLQKTAAVCVGGATTNFVYDTAGHLIGEYDATGAVIQETVWLGNLPVAVFKPGSVSPYYVYADNLGTPRGITNSGGLLVWSWDGEPFGASPPVSGPGPQGAPFKYGLRFPGQYFDEETGYHHNGWREYIPELGRYAQSDPIGLAGGLNTYLYAYGNPLSVLDANGQVGEQLLPACLAGGPLDPLCSAGLVLVGGTALYAAYQWAMAPSKPSAAATAAAMRQGPRCNGVPTVVVDSALYPQAAAHIQAAQAAGHPSVVTVDRGGAAERRRQSMSYVGMPTTPGYDRDEWPMAMFQEGGAGASVRYIEATDNRGAGRSVGAQCTPVPDGCQVKVIAR